MTRLAAAIIFAVIAVALVKLWHDSRIWCEWPYIDDRDWLMEVDPYPASLLMRIVKADADIEAGHGVPFSQVRS